MSTLYTCHYGACMTRSMNLNFNNIKKKKLVKIDRMIFVFVNLTVFLFENKLILDINVFNYFKHLYVCFKRKSYY